jgi:Flp pilus assembly protein TadG
MSHSNSRQRWLEKLAAFAKCSRGNIAMMFGLTVIPMALAAGTGVDLARTMVARTQIADALDAAGLAVGATNGLDDAQMTDLARKYFNANYKTNIAYGSPSQPVVHRSGQDIIVTSSTNVPTVLMNIVGIRELPVNVSITVTRSSVDLEVALALDTTGSMAGTKIADLKVAAKDLIDLVVQDNQDLNYSKVALVPYSMGVNVGTYADQVRGPIAPGKSITDVTWKSGPARNITGATRENPVKITSNSHGLSNGDRIRISGVGGMTVLNNKEYTVTSVTTNTFKLQGVDGTKSSYKSYTSGGAAQKCLNTDCNLVVTASSHGFANGDYVVFKNIAGLEDANEDSALNDKNLAISGKTTDTFIVPVHGPDYSSYTSGGSAYCTVSGCRYIYFTNSSGGKRLFEISTCVSERTGTDAFTDAAPGTTYLGRNYPAPTNGCSTAPVTPLSTDRTSLKAAVDDITAGGSTGGHIGVGWTWYMLSPNFGSLWPAGSQPAAYGKERLLKVAIIMTDGEYNSMYCNGVISQDSTTGSGNTSDHINCNAANGHAFDQATTLCTKMKAAGVIVYTVGFQVVSDPRAQALVANCATDSSHVYLPATGAELKTSFHAIGQEITQLRLAR